MNIKTVLNNGQKIAVIESDNKVITDTQSALDLIMTVSYDTGINRIAISKSAVADEFFILSSGIAGEILQKFITYKTKFAIFGDYSKYTSKPLKDFIYESNNGKDIFFVADEKTAVDKLSEV